ncbi:SDR family oxidoreductase [Rossellomorea marisflavi]|uniref:SDR family oxidoreductase n=1 Tax=Rossellomorea TaxID=2837508 RepID=UPI00064F25F7|nr:SDR family oxidoreductase [Rossellomorea marisflavi]KML06818.1 short-chain dehydrogenase [Rossellomorea marisflavi]KML35397.1 short-chain dehydrogenase [Rossellomorea marisflavi]TYO72579.1 SDR family oxidoreductase [Rossellomorea marisflavi]
MNQKVAIVTGSNSGFGLLTAVELAKNGFRVVATMRDTAKKEDLLRSASSLQVEDRIFIQELDVTSALSLESFKEFLTSLDRIDVLVNNAGFAQGGFLEEVRMDEFRQQFETNVFGVIGVSQLILPYMRRQGSGKIINIGSISGRIGFPGLSPYVSSKHALAGLSESLRLEVKPFGIDVHLIEAGSYQTNIWSTGKKITERSLQSESPYHAQMKKLNAHLVESGAQYGAPRDVSSLVAAIANGRKRRFKYAIGKGTGVTILVKSLLPWKTIERIILHTLR